MGNILKVGVSWTPQGIEKTLKTKFSVGVGGLPTQIKITRMPYKLDYKDGEAINPAGMIVHAYYEDGTDFGTVLESALTLDPLTAQIDTGSNNYSKDGVNALAVYADEYVSFTNLSGYKSTSYLATNNGLYRFHAVGDPNDIVYYTKYNGNVYIATTASTDGLIVYMTSDENGTNRSAYSGYGATAAGANYRFAPASSFINDLAVAPQGGLLSNIPESSVDPTTVDFSGATPSPALITVKWPRPVDGQVLETSFSINID